MMSTPFNVRQIASEAGIQTTGGFAVIAECVTQDELERFAQIAISKAAKKLTTANYENQCKLEKRIEELESELAKARSVLRQARRALEVSGFGFESNEVIEKINEVLNDH